MTNTHANIKKKIQYRQEIGRVMTRHKLIGTSPFLIPITSQKSLMVFTFPVLYLEHMYKPFL